MLPRDNQSTSIRPPQRWRISVGETYQASGSSGLMIPRKLDYFTIRHLVKQGGRSTYVVDVAMQEKMCKAACVKEKPTAIPVRVIGNPSIEGNRVVLPDSILFAEMAKYWGGRRECCCGAFGEDGTGIAMRRKYEEKTSPDSKRKWNVKVGEVEIPCDPTTCPFATGNHGISKYEGVKLCKPHVIANLDLPWSPAVGAMAKFVTTGWNSYQAMKDSLLFIAGRSGGWLHDLPLWLVLDIVRSGDNLVPQVRFEFRGSVDALREVTIPSLQKWNMQEQTLKALQAGAVDTTYEVLNDPDVQAAEQVEFYPEGRSDVPVIDDPDVIDVPEEDVTPAPAPTTKKAPARKLLATCPQDAQEIVDALKDKGIGEEVITALKQWAWQQVIDEPRDTLPGPSTCESPAEQEAVTDALFIGANNYWANHAHEFTSKAASDDE